MTVLLNLEHSSSFILLSPKMGQVISAIRESVREADKVAEEKAKQDLDILQKLVDSKLNQFQHELNE